MSDDTTNWEPPQYKPPMISGTSYHPTFADMANRVVPVEFEPGLLDANYNGDIVETLRQIDTMLRNRMGAVEPLLSQVFTQLADIQTKLTRMEPLLEYAEQLLEQRTRLAKLITGGKKK